MGTHDAYCIDCTGGQDCGIILAGGPISLNQKIPGVRHGLFPQTYFFFGDQSQKNGEIKRKTSFPFG